MPNVREDEVVAFVVILSGQSYLVQVVGAGPFEGSGVGQHRPHCQALLVLMRLQVPGVG